MGDSRRESVERVPVPPVNLDDFLSSQTSLGYAHRFRHPVAGLLQQAYVLREFSDDPKEFYESSEYTELKSKAKRLVKVYRQFMEALPDSGLPYRFALQDIKQLSEGNHELDDSIYVDAMLSTAEWEKSRFGPSRVPKDQVDREVA